MTVEFIKAHTGKNQRHFTVGQIVEIADAAEVQDLVQKGIAKEHKPGGQTESTGKIKASPEPEEQ